jgi:UDP-N-acetylmuramoyl-tripeptide--D-alanyl-D-alanine ligase
MTQPLFGALGLLLVLTWLRPLLLAGLRGLHILQLEEYQTLRYLRWQTANLGDLVDAHLLATAIGVALVAALAPGPAAIAIVLLGTAIGTWATRRRRRPEAKKPLVLTARAKRLLGSWLLSSAILLVATVVVLSARLADLPSRLILGTALGLALLAAFAWPLFALTNLLLYPVEASFRAYYLRSARHILTSYAPTVIGIAGSYGKTSTKAILAQILSTRFEVLMTPRSFNTPMGLCRVIREQLQPSHQFFIAELGAYQRGEVRQLCRLVQPSIGVLTAIGPEHLERFGSLANVIEGEFELIEALPAGGLAIFNGDDETCRDLARRAKAPHLLVGGPPEPTRELSAEAISLSSVGLRFTICHRDGRWLAVGTRLLGRHNVANILLASAAALQVGFPFEELASAIERLEPVEHRLQLVPNDNGVVVIDDTYNSNPRGAAAALETLAAFQGGRRYLVTPGMVELAELQDGIHRDFGRQAAGVCDAVILVGPRRTRAIAEGLTAAGFAAHRLIVTRDLGEATEKLRTLLQRGDAVLFENDLPDNYAE